MKIRILSSAAERAAHNRLVDGSNPSGSTGIAFRIVYRIFSPFIMDAVILVAAFAAMTGFLNTLPHLALSMPALNKPSFINAGIFILLASVALLIR